MLTNGINYNRAEMLSRRTGATIPAPIVETAITAGQTDTQLAFLLGVKPADVTYIKALPLDPLQ